MAFTKNGDGGNQVSTRIESARMDVLSLEIGDTPVDVILPDDLGWTDPGTTVTSYVLFPSSPVDITKRTDGFTVSGPDGPVDIMVIFQLQLPPPPPPGEGGA